VLETKTSPARAITCSPGRESPARGRGRPLREKCQKVSARFKSRPSLEVLPDPWELEAIYSTAARHKGGALADHHAVF